MTTDRHLIARGIRVSALGFGGAPIGNLFRRVTEDEAQAALATAIAGGVRYFDTAPFYGHGLSEECIGRALAGHARDRYVLSTKVGRLLKPNPTGVFTDGRTHPLPFDPVYDYSYDGIMRSFEDSFQRLGLARDISVA